jgi:hypothetical protein
VERFRVVAAPPPQAKRATKASQPQQKDLLETEIFPDVLSLLGTHLRLVDLSLQASLVPEIPGPTSDVSDPAVDSLGLETICDDSVLNANIQDVIQSSPIIAAPEHFPYPPAPEVSPFGQAYNSLITSSYHEIPGKLPTVYFPLSSDHLLHLIHHNVFRALITNKALLSATTSLIKRNSTRVMASFVDLCDGLSVIQSKPGEILPPPLYPTPAQMTIAHSSWLNMFPHSKFRHNLIEHEDAFNAYDFCNDLFGEMIAGGRSFSSVWAETPNTCDEADDEITSNRRGLIVWGEAWDPEGYEVTPGFVRKWPWVLKGCEDLIVASNRWRAKRSEEPLCLPF